MLIRLILMVSVELVFCNASGRFVGSFVRKFQRIIDAITIEFLSHS